MVDKYSGVRCLRAQVAFREFQVMSKFYWHRLVGTAGAWFFWDVSFYGNKVRFSPCPPLRVKHAAHHAC